VAYPIFFLLPLDNGAYLQSDVQSGVAAIRNNTSLHVPEKKKKEININYSDAS